MTMRTDAGAPTPTAAAASEAGDDGIEDGDDTVDDGVEDGANGVDNSH
jgi:hypothetical protein